MLNEGAKMAALSQCLITRLPEKTRQRALSSGTETHYTIEFLVTYSLEKANIYFKRNLSIFGNVIYRNMILLHRATSLTTFKEDLF
jgi:hypothetical protein